MTIVPKIPSSLETKNLSGLSSFMKFWKRQSQKQEAETKEQSDKVLKSVVAVDDGRMMNLVPQDTVHPFYHPSCTELTNTFILDQLSEEEIKLGELEDPLLVQGGLTIRSLSGKELLLKRKDTGLLTVNGHDVGSVDRVDGITVILVQHFLFNHFEDVERARKEITAEMHKKNPNSLRFN